MNKKPASNTMAQPNHRVRTLIASFFGTVATCLVIFSILIVWANQTLLNNTTYVATVAPLASSATVKNYMTSQLSNQLFKNQQVTQIAAALLPASVLSTQTTQQITAQVQTIVNQSIDQALNSPAFKQLWITTNRNLHASLINQLNANASTINLNLQPAISGLVGELSQTRLGPFASQISLPGNAGQISINASALARVHNAYNLFKDATWAIVLITLICIGLAIWISVHHRKTIRRIAVSSGILCLFFGLALTVPSIVGHSLDSSGSGAIAVEVVKLLIRRLQIAFLVIGGALILLGIVSKLISNHDQSKSAVK